MAIGGLRMGGSEGKEGGYLRGSLVFLLILLLI